MSGQSPALDQTSTNSYLKNHTTKLTTKQIKNFFTTQEKNLQTHQK
jgi:hypothetical protein